MGFYLGGNILAGHGDDDHEKENDDDDDHNEAMRQRMLMMMMRKYFQNWHKVGRKWNWSQQQFCKTLPRMHTVQALHKLNAIIITIMMVAMVIPGV